LPRSTQQPLADPRSVGERRIESRRTDARGCVLLVEDNDEVAALVTEMLEELGYHVTRVASAQAALGALANGRRIDLVFSDIMMPGEMDGVGLAREIRKRREHLPIVLTSGYAEPALRDAEAEGLRVLGKPYRLDELERALRTALEATHRHSSQSPQVGNRQSS